MELDDLRRQWQQPETTPLPESPAELGEMLAHNSSGLVDKMRRNTWYEAIFTVLMAAAVPFYLWNYWGQAFYMLMGAVMVLLSAILLVNYYQQLQLLRRMTYTETQVRAHLGTLSAGLRRQLHFYYRLTLATAPLTLILLLGFYVGKELAHPGAFHGKFIATMAAVFVVLGAVVQVGMVYLTRWYLQRLYGQHLDRLEASLRELEEDKPERAG